MHHACISLLTEFAGLGENRKELMLQAILDNRCRSLTEDEIKDIRESVDDEARIGENLFGLIENGDVPIKKSD